MALRAGYYGLKGSAKRALEKLAGDTSGMKIIKSFGDGLNLTSNGKLNLTAATDNKIGGVKVGNGLTIENGVLSVEGGGKVVLQDVNAILVSANTPVTVDNNSYYAHISDNNFTVSGGVLILGSPTEYYTIDGIGFCMGIIQTTSTSLTISKSGVLIKLDGLTLDYKPFIGGFITGTKVTGSEGSIYMGVSGDTNIVSDEIDVISSAIYTYPTGQMPDFKVLLFRLTETVANFNSSITVKNISAILDALT